MSKFIIQTLEMKLASLERPFLNKDHRIETDAEKRNQIRQEKNDLDKEIDAINRKINKTNEQSNKHK